MVEHVVEQYPAADTIHLVMDNLPCSGKLRGRNRYAQSLTNCQIATQLVQNTVIEPFQAVRDLAPFEVIVNRS
jgi:hypothetical protein